MVYCGKPSKACRECRHGNIKCDKKKDTCGQCRRAQIVCPGYRNPRDLVFRDETPTVLRKVLRDHSPGISGVLWEPLEDRAKKLFIFRHVLGESPVLVYMPFFFTTASLPPQIDYFETTLKTVSLAYLANEVHSPDIRLHARKKYSSALRLAQQSLKRAEVVTQNLTLLNTLLLDHFEDLTAKGSQQGYISSHIEGAVALAVFRGHQQFQDPLSKAIFMHLSSRIFSSYLMRKMDIPVAFLRLHSEVRRFTNVQDTEWQMSELMVRIAEFECARREGRLFDLDLILQLQKFKEELEMISRAMEVGVPSVSSNTVTIHNIARLTNDIDFLHTRLSNSLILAA